MGSLKLEDVKRFDELNFRWWKALGTKLGGLENVKAIIQGDKAVEIKIKDSVALLFDKHGRRIPKDLENLVRDPFKDFHLEQPEIDYAERLIRFTDVFHLSCAEFKKESKELIKKIKNNSQTSNLLNGVYLPIVLPQIKAKNFDYGRILEEVFLTAVGKAYKKQFPSRDFINYRTGDLQGKVSIIPESRHDQLINKMKEDMVVGIYFPNPLQGFSILAAREQISTLSEDLILSGGFDTSAATAMYPDVLARDYRTPGYDLAALSWDSGGSLCFEASANELFFDCRTLLFDTRSRYSSGLLFLG